MQINSSARYIRKQDNSDLWECGLMMIVGKKKFTDTKNNITRQVIRVANSYEEAEEWLNNYDNGV